MKQTVFRTLMLRDLAQILACELEALPAVFLIEGEPRPLKIRIHEDLLARYPVADPVRMSRWFRLWTGRTNYEKAVCFGAERRDLDGAPAGTIAAEAREAARKRIVGECKAKAAAKAPSPPALGCRHELSFTCRH